MKTIDTYIKEAFITKDNIKDAIKANKTNKFCFVAVGGESKYFNDYEELLEIIKSDYMENKRVQPNNVYTKKRNSMPNNVPKDFDIGKGSYDLYSDIVFDDADGTHSYSDMWIGCINCQIGDTRLEEAFITKKNIETIANEKPFAFVPYFPHLTEMFKHIFEFDKLDELIDYFYGIGKRWCTPLIIEDTEIIDIKTVEEKEYLSKYAPKDVKQNWDDAYKLYVILEVSDRKQPEEYFAGYVNASKEEME